MSVAIPSLRGAIAVPEWAKNELWRKAQAAPSLDLRFADFKSLADATTGTNLIDFTRASSGTYVGSDGLIKTATTNTPRFNHDPTTGESLGLMVEESGTNFILNSSPATTGFALGGAVADTVSGVLAPDGQLYTVRRVTYPSTGAWRFGDTVSGTAGTTYTGSVWIKTESGTVNINLDINDAVPGKTVTVTQNWQRFDANGSHATNPYRFFDISGGVGQVILFWGAQLEEGSFPTSYVPTEGSQVTRAADVASISGANFSSWYRQDEGTVFVDSERPDASRPNTVVASITDGTAANRIEVRSSSATNDNARCEITTLGSGQFGNPALSSNTAYKKIALAYAVNNVNAAANGNVGTTDTAASIPVVSQLYFGNDVFLTNYRPGHIKRLTYWPTRLSDATLQAITQ